MTGRRGGEMQRKVLGADASGRHTPLERVTIRDFVSSNDKLLAVLGVFLGAAAFSTSSPVKPVGQVVVFCLLGVDWFLWFELFAIYRNEEGTNIPSNIHGLVYIPFPKGYVDATFGALRRELEAAFSERKP